MSGLRRTVFVALYDRIEDILHSKLDLTVIYLSQMLTMP